MTLFFAAKEPAWMYALGLRILTFHYRALPSMAPAGCLVLNCLGCLELVRKQVLVLLLNGEPAC